MTYKRPTNIECHNPTYRSNTPLRHVFLLRNV